MKTRNKSEEGIANQLRRAKILFEYETEKIPYVLARHYLIDFKLYTPLGKIYIEYKGYLRPEDKCKLLAVKRQHPNMDLRIVFYEYKERQIKWATKNGFRYAIGNIPEEWLLGL